MTTIAALAALFAGSFRRLDADDDKRRYTLNDDAPEWMLDIVRDAHGGLMVNDRSYEMILSVANEIDDYFRNEPDSTFDDLDEVMHERIDSLIPVYNTERTAWLASHLDRAEYVNEAMREYGVAKEEPDIFQLIAMGIEVELRNIWASVTHGLTEQADDDDPDEEE